MLLSKKWLKLIRRGHIWIVNLIFWNQVISRVSNKVSKAYLKPAYSFAFHNLINISWVALNFFVRILWLLVQEINVNAAFPWLWSKPKEKLEAKKMMQNPPPSTNACHGEKNYYLITSSKPLAVFLSDKR